MTEVRPAGETGVAGSVERARRRIEAAAAGSGADASRVRLIAVTKTVAAARVREALDAGLRDLGENKVQEAVAKRAELVEAGAAEVTWHLIGHLQTNKAGRAAGAFDWAHSVDSERVAAALDARRPADLPALDVLVEVELTGLPGRTGAVPADLPALAECVGALPRLRLRGLMTMAAPVSDPEEARPTFARLRELRDDLERRLGTALPELSMGMSDDFEAAVAEGATIVRLGRALFGARPPRPGRPPVDL